MDDSEFDDLDDEMPLAPPKAAAAVARALARAFLAGGRDPAGLRERATKTLGRPWPWLVPLCLRLHFEYARALTPPACDELVAWILKAPEFLAAFASPDGPPAVRAHYPWHPQMAPRPPALAGLALPALATPGELADWLGLSPEQLDWFANPGQWRHPAAAPRLEHYRYRWLTKADGSPRLIEAPKEQLRAIQRRILHRILDRVPAHATAYGCVKGRSVVANAGLHAGKPLLLKMDLRDFFVGIAAGRIHALFRTLGYPRETARYLTGLTTLRTPPAILRQAPAAEYPSPEERRRQRAWARGFLAGHLPQGAPTSPALANLCAYRLDLRLAAAARACGGHYSRYVDDLALSLDNGERAHGRRLMRLVTDIVLEEGYAPNWRKSRILTGSEAQRLTGLVVNRHPNLPRAAYDTLKAILHNCLRDGPASQNRDSHPDFRAHLRGRIAWLRQINPERADKLQACFERIVW